MYYLLYWTTTALHTISLILMLSKFVAAKSSCRSFVRFFVLIELCIYEQSKPGDNVQSYIRFIGPDGVVRYGQPEGEAAPKVRVE